MDINKVTDVKELKSLAYDRLAYIEQAQAELRAINARIQEVLSQPADTSDEEQKGGEDGNPTGEEN